jgi:hypothetical protein
MLADYIQARKPYTISKQREKWTEDEHKLFLESLQLHGRAWRRIQGKCLWKMPFFALFLIMASARCFSAYHLVYGRLY